MLPHKDSVSKYLKWREFPVQKPGVGKLPVSRSRIRSAWRLPYEFTVLVGAFGCDLSAALGHHGIGREPRQGTEARMFFGRRVLESPVSMQRLHILLAGVVDVCYSFKQAVRLYIQPGNLTMESGKIHPWKIIFPTLIFRFYIKLRGCRHVTCWVPLYKICHTNQLFLQVNISFVPFMGIGIR